MFKGMNVLVIVTVPTFIDSGSFSDMTRVTSAIFARSIGAVYAGAFCRSLTDSDRDGVTTMEEQTGNRAFVPVLSFAVSWIITMILA